MHPSEFSSTNKSFIFKHTVMSICICMTQKLMQILKAISNLDTVMNIQLIKWHIILNLQLYDAVLFKYYFFKKN